MSMKNVAGAAATAPATKRNSGPNQSTLSMSILTNSTADVKLLDALAAQRIDNAEIVAAVRTICEGFDKSLLSKIRKPGKYGVRFIEPVARLLREQFVADPQAAPRKPARRKPMRIQCRLSEAAYRLLQRRLAQTGVNIQDYLEGMIIADLLAHQDELNEPKEGDTHGQQLQPCPGGESAGGIL